MIAAEFVRLVEYETGLPAGTIAGPSRKAAHVRVRTALIMVLRARMREDADGALVHRLSLPQIGALLNRDHSTICAALDRAKALSASDRLFPALCARIQLLAEADDTAERLIAARIAAVVPAPPPLPEPNNQNTMLEQSLRQLASSLPRQVRPRNDMLADDFDGMARARGSIALAEAIRAARAA